MNQSMLFDDADEAIDRADQSAALLESIPSVAEQADDILLSEPEGFSLFGRDLFGEAITPDVSGPLAQRFVMPPFSVLNARDGAWQARKRAWLACGIQSELGRETIEGNNSWMAYAKRTTPQSEAYAKIAAAGIGTIFDPTLTELMYSWFCPPGGSILDPFAGGSVRGIVAAKLGYHYVGIELRPEQLAANQEQADRICVGDDVQPVWIEGDSLNLAEIVAGQSFDCLFSSPPYFNLEVYSDDPRDLSAMPWESFVAAYTAIIAATVSLLKPDRFACFVIGDVRDKKGFYRCLPELTVAAFQAAGALKYNDAVLVTAVGSLPIRVGKQFAAGRKLGKAHQSVLVFVKGDPKRAAEACGSEADGEHA